VSALPERLAKTLYFLLGRPRTATSYRIGAGNYPGGGPRVGFALGNSEEVYAAILFDPDHALRAATQIRLRCEEGTRDVPKVSNDIAEPPFTIKEKAHHVRRFLAGKAFLAENFNISQNLLDRTEPVVIKLGSVRGNLHVASYAFNAAHGLDLARRLEKAATVARHRPVGRGLEHIV
jgi:hypothetical protein